MNLKNDAFAESTQKFVAVSIIALNNNPNW